MTHRAALLLTAALLCALPAAAQNAPLPRSNAPLEITADKALEWNRKDRRFIARENARAQQGEATLAAATLTADYREVAGKGMDISRIIAEGDVVISSRDSHAYGERAVYDLATGLATMTGAALRMVAPDQTVTARDSFEYNVPDGRLVAKGNAQVTRKNARGEINTLEADTITAILQDMPENKRALQRLEAAGNVVITTPTEIVTGAQGIYRADNNTAELSGGVTIKRGPNILQGERAVVDLTANTSQMFGSPGSGSRVRGVFYPGSERKEAP